MALLCICAAAAHAQNDAGAASSVKVSADQLLAAVEAALQSGNSGAAETMLQVLANDPHLPVRNEARFRLAMLAGARGDLRRGALLLRAILDEEPSAQRVRLELARILGAMGDLEGARRELRQVHAGALPPEVARVVDRFSAALRQYKRFGGGIELALAPDSNITRATRSDTLNTVLGNFVLNEDAQAQSGLGIAARANGFVWWPLSNRVKVLAQAVVDANLYRHSQFNDISATLAVGPEIEHVRGRLQAQARFQRRWFGERPLSETAGVEGVLEQSLGKTAQLRLTVDLSRTWFKPNRLQDATATFASATFEKALSARSGTSLSVTIGRQVARDPAYSNWFEQISALGWQELGHTTLFAGASYARLQADARLLLYPAKRHDETIRLSLGATLRRFSIGGFAPQLRATWEGNSSPIEIYRYRRLRGEIGIVRAF
jgi:hypothetical protein